MIIDDVFVILVDCMCSLEAPNRVSSNEYLQSMV